MTSYLTFSPFFFKSDVAIQIKPLLYIYIMFFIALPSLSVYGDTSRVYALNGAFLMDALGRQVILTPNR